VNGSPKNGENLFCCWKNMGGNQWKCLEKQDFRGKRIRSVDYFPVRGSNPGEGEIFQTRPDWPWGPPSLLYNGYQVFPGGKAARAWR